MAIRHKLGYPPYYFTIGLTLSHKNENFLIKKSYEVQQFLRENLSGDIGMLGPTPKHIARTHNLYHYQILLKYRKEERLDHVLNRLLDWSQEVDQKELRFIIDNEPQNLM